MTVILGRYHGATGDAASVHAWRVPDVGVGVLSSACGLNIDPAALERVERFSGAPCAACLLTAMHDRGPRLPPDPIEVPPEVPQDGPPPSPYRYGVALRGGAEVHLVEPGAVSGQLDGRTVVQALCAFLAWGPLPAAPGGWPVCGECREVAAL